MKYPFPHAFPLLIGYSVKLVKNKFAYHGPRIESMLSGKAKESSRKEQRTILLSSNASERLHLEVFVLFCFYLLASQFHKLIGGSLTVEKVMIISHCSGS